MSDIGPALQILQIILILGTVLFAASALRNSLGNTVGDIKDIKIELKKLGDVIIGQAVASKRLDNIEEDVRDLKHGRGFITKRSAGGIDGEYP